MVVDVCFPLGSNHIHFPLTWVACICLTTGNNVTHHMTNLYYFDNKTLPPTEYG